MNAQEYIASGLLEAYVLGSLSSSETAEVEEAIRKYPELAEGVASIEETVFRMAERQAVPPPPHLQDRIWNALSAPNAQAPAQPATTIVPPKTIVLPESRQPQWARAAIWIVLIGSLLANFLLWQQGRQDHQYQLALRQELDTLQKKQQVLTAVLDRYHQEADLMADPDMQAVHLLTTRKDHPMAATVYWSKGKEEAYVAVQKLPMPPAGRQYQLWVIAEGKPVNLGVLPNEMISSTGIQKVPMAVTAGQAFAISLEKEGGSLVPSMDQIFVMGKVAS